MAEFSHKDINSVDIDDGAIIEYVRDAFTPEDIFSFLDLEDWAINNGFIEEE